MYLRKTVILLLFLYACVELRDNRLKLEPYEQGANTTDEVSVVDEPVQEQEQEQEDEISLPEGADHCSFSRDGRKNFSQRHTSMGGYNACQSSKDSHIVFLQMERAEAEFCIVPFNIKKTDEDEDAWIYIGEARCRTLFDNKRFYAFDLIKNREGFETRQINGVMILKNQVYFYEAPFERHLRSTTALMECMEFLNQHEDPTYCESFNNLKKHIQVKFN